MAQKTGLPAAGFIAATNVNDVVPRYLETGDFRPKPSERTLSNAMDVGNPSNFERMLHLYDGGYKKMRCHVWSESVSDSETKQAIREVYNGQDYLMDPHTAVGYRAVQRYRKSGNPYFGEEKSTPVIILSTAHPAKFGNVIESAIGREVDMPQRLKACLDKEKQSIPMSNDFDSLKQWLINSYS
jgi:threonine synthase